MKLFETMQIKAAKQYAKNGGQALHMMRGEWAKGWRGPKCFRNSKEFAHLLDQDDLRLLSTAHRLGVRVVRIQRCGTIFQHVDLCGKPLAKALSEVETTERTTP